MKTYIKTLCCALLALLLALSAAACADQIETTVPAADPQPVSLALTGYRETFAFGEAFETGGLAVTAKYSDGTTKTLNTEEYSVFSEAFDSSEPGTYRIEVSMKGTKLSKDYTVTVGVERYTDSLKILAIGNSFSDDSLSHVYNIAKDYGADVVVLGVLYIGGCSLQTHVSNLRSDAHAYDYRKNTAGVWETSPNTSMLEGIVDEDWDIISLQQASGFSGMAETYNEDLDELIEYVSANRTVKDGRLVWNMTWAYQGDSSHSDFVNYDNDQATMYGAITDAVQEQILTRAAFDTVIPAGTAVQNVRTSYLGDTLTRDGYHLSYTVGRYIASLTWVKSLTGWDISRIDWVPDDSTMSPEVLDMIRESVLAAVETPYEVTPSSYDEQPAPDLEGLVESDWQPVALAFWNSTSAPYDSLQSYSATAKQFVSSARRYTREELPVGSVIVIAEGWRYRPEGWASTEGGQQPSATRPDNVSVQYVYVTESWWGDFQLRAFNVSLISGDSVTDRCAEGAAALKIYVPEGTPNADPALPAADDAALFEENGLDIAKYTRLDWDPICGYFNSQTSALSILATDSYAKNYITTGLFTPQTLPVGSVVVLDEGWTYRPEKWLSEETQASRPGNVSKAFTLIDEGWWGDNIYRAFNLGKSPTSSLAGQAQEAASHLRIYLPAE